MDSSADSDKSSRHSARKLRAKLSKSQPDLSALSLSDREKTILRHTLGNSRKDQQRCAQMVDHLMKENKSLKSELESCYNKVAKAHKLEEEVGKVTRAHEELVATCERRERLEHARIARLQAEVRRLQEANQRLVASHLVSPDHSRNHLAKREALIAQLVTQNKELQAAKERQEIELAAQRATLQEQRTHIDILDTALINAQANVVRLEEECRQKQVHVERVGQLQRALSSLQLASDRREQTERKLRLQLEQELQNERAKHNNSQDGNGELGDSLPELKRQLREKDEKIMRLEGEVAKWEQKYLEESQLRQAAIDAASIPKDAKIAALEKTSQETEKLIAEARSDRIRQMDEVHAAQKRVTDLEAKVKELECKLAERDAMIRVLQNKHTLDKEVSSSYPSISLSHHPSLNATDLNVLAGDDLGGVSTTSVFSTVSSALTGSTGFGSEAPYSGGGGADSYHKYSTTPAESYHKSLDDQLKELDSQILSKRGLCCFPGFSHPSAASRKGKIPQPLLAGVASSSSNRHDDMELLERQGLCSQQQRQSERCNSLPPSSLPRPKRSKAAQRERKLGEYGRLSDSETTNKTSNNSRMIPLSNYAQQERKMSDPSEVKNTRESPSRSIIPRSYSRLEDNKGDPSRSESRYDAEVKKDNKRESPESSEEDCGVQQVRPLPPERRSGPQSGGPPDHQTPDEEFPPTSQETLRLRVFRTEHAPQQTATGVTAQGTPARLPTETGGRQVPADAQQVQDTVLTGIRIFVNRCCLPVFSRNGPTGYPGLFKSPIGMLS
ncbi:hypothetical protein AAG570_005900 [Ranatra chinensis]|uniref:Angiomotin C-terminal domain-containing protein n=1 Tax=Ranatra chinensis TaxID=642074 RepID=A0ABD0YK62_9HEMI